eukprot:SAG11_NODE_3491_length_2415_cov_2.138601_1_plen_198_part_00
MSHRAWHGGKSDSEPEGVCWIGLLALMALARPETWGASLWYFWILPHMLGAGHLRYYQTAEHRGVTHLLHHRTYAAAAAVSHGCVLIGTAACRLGSFTDTSAWITSRTTTTWWLYAKLAWNMPYHSEHHAWPNVPFHVLPEVSGDTRVLLRKPSTALTANSASLRRYTTRSKSWALGPSPAAIPVARVATHLFTGCC